MSVCLVGCMCVSSLVCLALECFAWLCVCFEDCVSVNYVYRNLLSI